MLTAGAGVALLIMHGGPPRAVVTANRVAVPPAVRQPLAPAASLAGVPLPPDTGPVVRPPYKPAAKADQVAEVLSLRSGQPVGQPAAPTTAAPKPSAAAEAGPSQTPPVLAGQPPPAAHDADHPPPGYVPSEPGSTAAQAAQVATPGTTTASATPAHTDAGTEPPAAAASPAPAQTW